MNITLGLQRPVSAADLSIKDVERSTQLSKDEKIGEASRQFEAMLLRQILTEAQKPITGQKSGDTAGAIYDDIMTAQFADEISHSRALGIAEVLQGQLSGQARQKKAENTKVDL